MSVIKPYTAASTCMKIKGLFMTPADSLSQITTVDSRYLEVEGTRWNTSRYPYFDISDVQNWGKYQTNNQNFTNEHVIWLL